MINLQKNSSNTIVLTLTEKCTLTNPYFLFQFTSADYNNEIVFVADDTSLYQSRYNKFEIIESPFENLTGGTVSLRSGSYDYTIYEQTEPYNLNLDFSGITTAVETGKVLVEGEDTELDEVYR
jgi:hypothetical protein